MCIFLWANSFFYSNIKLLKITENHITLSIESICVSVFQSPSLSIKIWRHLWQNILFCVSHKMSMYEMNVVHMCANCISFDSMKTFNIILTFVFLFRRKSNESLCCPFQFSLIRISEYMIHLSSKMENIMASF